MTVVLVENVSNSWLAQSILTLNFPQLLTCFKSQLKTSLYIDQPTIAELPTLGLLVPLIQL